MSKNEIYEASPQRYGQADSFFRRAGRRGVLLPAVSLGLWKNFGEDRPLEECRRLIHFAFDHGVTHFDLANNYGPPPGAAETMLGRLMRSSMAPYRDELFIATKAGYEMWPGPYGNWGSRKSLMASLDQSLHRMNVDYVDLFYTHRFDPVTPLEETLQALVDAVRRGKALYVGISRWPLEATLAAFEYLNRRDVPCLCLQGRVNLLDRAPLTGKLLDAAREEGCGFVSFSPLAQGLLTNRYMNGIVPADSRMSREASLPRKALTPSLLGRLEKLEKLARRRGDSLARLALRWVMDLPGMTSVIVGASCTDQLADNLKVIESTPLTDEEQREIDRIMSA